MNNEVWEEIIKFLIGIPGELYVALVTLVGLLYTIIYNTQERSNISFQEAVSNLSNHSPTVRSVSIQILAHYVTTFYFPWNRKKIHRKFIVARALANHFIYEKNPHLRNLCVEVLKSANWQVRYLLIDLQYQNNLLLWDKRCKLLAAVKTHLISINREINNHKPGEKKAKLSSFPCYQANSKFYLERLREFQDKFKQYDEQLDVVQNLLAILLKKQRLRPLNLRGVHFEFCDLIGVNLSGCDLTGATITHSNLKNAKLKNAKFERAIFLHCYFLNNNLSNSKFKDAVLCRNHLDGLKNHESLKQSRLLIWNKIKNCSKIKQEQSLLLNKTIEVWWEKEFDWTGVWITKRESNNSILSAEWMSSDSNEIVKANMRENYDNGLQLKSLTREVSTDGNNGEYEISSISKLEELNPSKPASLEYITGSRSIISCEQSWEAARWIIENPAPKCKLLGLRQKLIPNRDLQNKIAQ
ncbi:MAG: pentapeptide repeat-containing protein [Symploca sp. SIO3C6]|nr:pentapeptide repeat-containing protein [Symploca sp. SIO3C6]